VQRYNNAASYAFGNFEFLGFSASQKGSCSTVLIIINN
jgi:hypothetical protein